MEKKWINDVYVIEGIDSTSQLVAFYKEVVENNYEKYLGISTQGVKFTLDSNGEKAVQLKKGEEYGLNPHYRKIEVKPIEEVVEEHTQAENEQSTPVDVQEMMLVSGHNEIVAAKQMEIAQLQEKYDKVSSEASLHKERAENAEQMLEDTQCKNKELSQQVSKLEQELEQARNTCVKESQSEEYTIDSLLDELLNMGYKAYITKCN